MKVHLSFIPLLVLLGCIPSEPQEITIHLIGDSTMADYADNYEEGKDYYESRYPMTGWGQTFQPFFQKDKLDSYSGLFQTDSVVVKNHARGGRSTRTFFQEGRWRRVYESLNPGDLVLMQFGHNDAATEKTERYVPIEGYREFLRLYVSQTRERGATPIILTPVARNYPWEAGRLQNVHGDYPDAAREVAGELQVLFIDLNKLSMDVFSEKGQDMVTTSYFMNLDSGVYTAYPAGLNDNTHFQPEGAKVIAELVATAMKTVKK